MAEFAKGDRVKLSPKFLEMYASRGGAASLERMKGWRGTVSHQPRRGRPSVAVVWDGNSRTSVNRYHNTFLEAANG